MNVQDATRQFIDAIQLDTDPCVYLDEGVDWDVVLDELADGPYAADLFLLLCKRIDIIPHAPCLLSRLLSGLNDTAAAQETVGALCAIEPPRIVVRECFETLRKIAGDRDRHYGTRSAALRGVLYLSQSERSLLFYLQGDLLNLDLTDDPIFLRHAAAIVGLIASHKPDDAFLDLLHSLSKIPEATDESAYALGLIDLADALGESEREKAVDNFTSAKGWFKTAAAASAFRPDADLFAAVIEIILAFATEEPPSSIRSALPDLRESLFQQIVLTSPADGVPSDLSWIGQRAIEASHWASVGLAISHLADNLDRNAWLNPILVIENELFFLLSASRTLFRRNSAGGFEATLSPRIETHFVAEKAKLSLLNQWLDTKDSEPWSEDARRLRTGIQVRLEALASRNPPDAAREASPLAAIDSCEALRDSARDEVRALMEYVDQKFTLAKTDPIVNDLLESMLRRLRRNEDFVKHRDAAALFTKILVVTRKFLASRDNAQKTTANSYLFDRTETGPKESALHADYMDALRLSELARLCVLEPQDVGAGRADVLFISDAFRIASECKRTFANEDNAQAAEKFGGQLIAYQRSEVKFSALLILDLFDRDGAAEPLSKRATVEFVSSHGTEYALAVFRLQGRLKSPSQLRL
ncbi:MAG: hypothetical protein C3F11_09365 [Methylocystaceae bacterium]|nr:MAG: hypothetical protein C3F11_09365 [Methylocystaceae bacterium]